MIKYWKFGKRLQELRKRNGFTVLDTADKAGICPGTVWKVEGGRSIPRLDTAMNLCEAVGVDLIDVLELCR